MSEIKNEVIIGGQYGRLTVLDEKGKNKYGIPVYRVRCSCGKVYETSRPNILKKDAKCIDCGKSCTADANRRYRAGDEVNGFKLLEEVGKNKNGAILYRCTCLRCGSETIRPAGGLSNGKRARCKNCPPNYRFKTNGKIATGILPDGSSFVIDTELIEMISQRFWRRNSKGYIVTGNGNQKILLQWFVLGYNAAPKDMMIDHINQNKTDNRKDNLRFVDVHQNNLNHGITKANKSGYVGAFFDKSKNRWCGKITFNNRGIRLGYTENVIEAAQMYNVASEILFGEFAGHHNNVPNPNSKLIRHVYEKCRPFLSDAEKIQTPVNIRQMMSGEQRDTAHVY